MGYQPRDPNRSDIQDMARDARRVEDGAAEVARKRKRWELEGFEYKHTRPVNLHRWDEWVQRDEFNLWRFACRDHFWPFFMHGWGVMHGPHAESWMKDRAEIGQVMADWFEEQVRAWEESRAKGEKKQRRIMVIVAREFGKTTMFTQAGSAWTMLQNPDLSIYIGSDKGENAVGILDPVKAVLSGRDRHAKWVEMYGNWEGDDGTWRRDYVNHAFRTVSNRAASFGTWGVETGLTGFHPDMIILDDPNNYDKMAAQSDWLEFVNRSQAGLTPVLKADGLLMLVGTPYGDNDNLRTSLKRDGIASLTGFPMVDFGVRDDGMWHVLHIPGRDSLGKPTVPNVWSEERMVAYEKENPDHYAAQILLRPEISEHVPLTSEQVRDCLVDTKDIPLKMLRLTMHFDTAFKDLERKRKGDESVFQVWGHARDGSGDVFFIEGHSSHIWRGEDFYNEVVLLLQRYRAKGLKIVLVTDEQSAGKQGAGRILLESFCNAKGIAAPAMVEISRGGKKKLEQRIIPAATYWADGHVKLSRDGAGVNRLMEQMSRLSPNMPHDDWADAGADVFHPLVYNRMHRIAAQQQQKPEELPQDYLLKARASYDRFYGETITDYEPI